MASVVAGGAPLRVPVARIPQPARILPPPQRSFFRKVTCYTGIVGRSLFHGIKVPFLSIKTVYYGVSSLKYRGTKAQKIRSQTLKLLISVIKHAVSATFSPLFGLFNLDKTLNFQRRMRGIDLLYAEEPFSPTKIPRTHSLATVRTFLEEERQGKLLQSAKEDADQAVIAARQQLAEMPPKLQAAGLAVTTANLEADGTVEAFRKQCGVLQQAQNNAEKAKTSFFKLNQQLLDSVKLCQENPQEALRTLGNNQDAIDKALKKIVADRASAETHYKQMQQVEREANAQQQVIDEAYGAAQQRKARAEQQQQAMLAEQALWEANLRIAESKVASSSRALSDFASRRTQIY